jgi:hypothetical protein
MALFPEDREIDDEQVVQVKLSDVELAAGCVLGGLCSV